MSTIGITDLDFFKYEHVIPNLECAKLCTYFHNHKEIAVLTPYLDPAPYTHFYARKEYDDGIYPRQLFADNCVYGGRAFNPDHYEPLEQAIERTIPNMHLYDKYYNYFSHKPNEAAFFKRILNCAHIRLSTDEHTPKSINQLSRILSTARYTGIIFHDYDLGKIENACDTIYEISNSRHYVGKPSKINPYPIGTKFPVQIYSNDELKRWFKITAIPNLLSFQYNGLMTNENLYNLCIENRRMARQIYYNISEGSYTENDFLINILPKIFIQILFLRRQNIKILLKYNEEIIVTPEVKNFIELLNCWLSYSFYEGYLPTAQSLYQFCRKGSKPKQYVDWRYKQVSITIDEARDCFQFFRETNYELFEKFYLWDAVIYEGGQFLNEWGRYKKEDN